MMKRAREKAEIYLDALVDADPVYVVEREALVVGKLGLALARVDPPRLLR